MGTFPLRPGDYILGIDPGLESLGWGAALLAPDGKLYHRAHGCETTHAHTSMPERVDHQARALVSLVERFKPAVIAVEAWVPYAARGAKSFGGGNNTMRICGVVRAIGAVYRIPVVEFTAQAVKGILMGNRNAEKAQVQAAVKSYFELEKLPRPNHAADGLACAIAQYIVRENPGEVISKSAATTPAVKVKP